MKLTSNAFENEGKIPSKYTCDGENVSPQLTISDVPAETKSLVLIMDDPDFRGFWYGTDRLLLNAVFFGDAY